MMESSVGRRERVPTPTEETARPCERARRDAGLSVIEIIVAITLIGVLVVAILDSVRTGIVASSVSRDAAQVETVVVNAADRVNRAPMNCESDGYIEYVVAAVRSQGWWTGEGDFARAANVKHEYYYPDNPHPGTTHPWYEGVCPADDFGKRVVQRVTITISSPVRGVSRTMQVVKSDV